MRRLVLFALLAAAASVGPPDTLVEPSRAEAARPPKFEPPRGATLEPSGFATILSAPPQPYPARVPPSDRVEQESQRLAREAGISVSEAEGLMNPDEAAREAAMRLRRRLESGTRGNYVDMKIIRDPKPRFVFYFRRDAAATLARFTSDPRFQAVEGGVPAHELQPLFESWMQRFQQHRLASGGSVRSFEGDVEIDIGVSRSEFEAIAAREGWALPSQVKLNFAADIDPAQVVAADVAPFVRVFPQADRAPGIVLASAAHGRVILRDGCFRLDHKNSGYPLVLFGRDTQLMRDEEGYLTIRSLGNERSEARVGEEMVWGGYPPADEGEPGVQALRAQCGRGAIISVGEPTSAHQFRVRPWAIDSYSEVRGISRQAAWEEIKACWVAQDARVGAARRRGDTGVPYRDCDMPRPIAPPPPTRR